MNDTDKLIWIPPHRVMSQVSILAERFDYAHKLMNIPYMWKQTRGEGVKVCIIDTGVPKHVDIDVAGCASVIPGYMEDLGGHGTHVGGIIAAIANNNLGISGISPGVEDYYIAALDGGGAGSITDLATAIIKAVDHFNVDIINLSLGVEAGYATFRSLEAACDYAVMRGVTVIAAAGNENGPVGQPGCYDSVISVAAIDAKKRRAWFSNQGPELDFAAPGVQVYSTYLNNRYARLDGTSMASPMITGVAALIIADARKSGKTLTPEDVRAKIRKIAFDLGPAGDDELFGAGIPIFGKDSPASSTGPKDTPGGTRSYWQKFISFITGIFGK